VLSSGSLAARVAVLRDIIAQPTRVLSLGTHQGEDFVDLLLRLIPLSQEPLKKALTICLLCYEDRRTADFMVETFAVARDPETVLHLGQRLAHKGVDFFRPFLWGEQTAQALAAAQVCGEAGGLEPRDLLRVAILRGGPLPSIGEVWLDELAGPHRMRARQLAETLGEQVFWLWSVPLADSETEWLLRLTAELDPDRARQEVVRLFERGLFAVEMAVELGVELPARLLEHPSAEVRAVAIGAGLADASLESYLDRSLPEALAALGRCRSAVQVDRLTDSRWQIRSAAVRALAGASEPPLERVRALAGSEELGVRVAAVTLLEQWGDREWLLDFAGQVADTAAYTGEDE